MTLWNFQLDQLNDSATVNTGEKHVYFMASVAAIRAL